MKLDAKSWMNELVSRLLEEFGAHRIICIGLQGSYARGDMSDTSDIDAVLILDKLGFPELHRYKEIISSMPSQEKACGFVSGKEELLNWPQSDLFQFYYDTKPFFGSLDFLLPLLGRSAVVKAVRMGASNLYHGCCHAYLFENAAESLPHLLKTAFFLIQATAFLEHGVYLPNRELEHYVAGESLEILNFCRNRLALSQEEVSSCYKKLFHWASQVLLSCTAES